MRNLQVSRLGLGEALCLLEGGQKGSSAWEAPPCMHLIPLRLPKCPGGWQPQTGQQAEGEADGRFCLTAPKSGKPTRELPRGCSSKDSVPHVPRRLLKPPECPEDCSRTACILAGYPIHAPYKQADRRAGTKKSLHRRGWQCRGRYLNYVSDFSGSWDAAALPGRRSTNWV